MAKSARDSSLDAVKGFTILIVMLGHVLVLNKINDPVIYDWIKAVQMPLFMMVSGYLCGKAVKVGSFADYGRMLKKRAVGYLLPFFAWTLVFHLDDFTWAFPAYLEQPERGLWFLITLFVLTFMVYTAQLAEALLGGGRKGRIAFWLVYGALTVLVLLEARAGIPWLGPHLTKIYLPFYMAAYLWGEHQPRITAHFSPEFWKKLVNGIAIAGGIYCIAAAVGMDLMVMNGIRDYVLQNLASFGGCISVIVFFYRLRDGRCKRFLAWLGQYTLEIYSIHYHFARILNPGTLDFAVYSLPWLGFVAASFCGMSVLTALVVVACRHFQVTRFLLYGKK